MLNRFEVFDAPRGYADDLRKRLREHAFVIVHGTGPQPFADGTELGRIREAAPPYSWWPETHVNAHLLVDVSFDRGPPAYGAPVQSTLRRIRDEVHDAVKAIETHL